MEKKKIICASVCGCLALVCILAAAIIPPVLMSVLKDQVRTSTEMTENIHNIWGKVPGSMKGIPSHMYHFFHITNPEAVLYNGATPVLTEMNGYVYQEFDDYIERSYTDSDGTKGDKWVHFFSFQWVDVTDYCIWRNDTSPHDKITMINMGPFGAWDQMKRLPPEQIALTALYSLALGLNNDLMTSIYTEGILSFITRTDARDSIFTADLFNETEFDQIWYDPHYGWNNSATFTPWVNAYRENLVDGVFTYPSQIEGSLAILIDYFGIPMDFVNETLYNSTGEFVSFYNAISDIIEMDYCQYANATVCTGQVLGSLQWTQQYVTLNPPLGAPITSIASTNATVYGYPEISYFINATGLNMKYPDVTFPLETYLSLFDYDMETGWPSGSDYTLLDLGHITQFFAFGRAGNFSSIAEYLDLPSESHARVLWDYVNSLVSVTALLGNVDPEIFDKDNRGITSELSMGSLGSQSLYQTLYMSFGQAILDELSSRYAYSQFLLQNKNCTDFADQVSLEVGEICYKTLLQWSNTTQGFQYWYQAFDSGSGSAAWDTFVHLSGLSNAEMEGLYSVFNPIFVSFDEEIKTFYGCNNRGQRCLPLYLAEIQWGCSHVSLNLPGNMSVVMNLTGLHSMMDWGEPFKSMYVGRPEYGAYVLDRNLNESLMVCNYDDIVNLLNFDSLFGATPLQSMFVMDFMENFEEIEETYGVPDGAVMMNYMRYVIEKFGFGGMFTTRTVDEWLWTGVDPFLAGIQATNPLLGGNPATDPTSVQLGQNQTREEFFIRPKSYRHAMNTGKSKIDEVRWFRLYNGLPYINYLTKAYLGNNKWGPIIEYATVNPWKEPVPLKGGDTWNFQPNIGSDSNIVFFLDSNQRVANGTFVDHRTEHGFDIYRYRVGPELLSNVSVNPMFDVFYQYGPNGVVNQTSVMGSPLFASKPYFLDGDPVLGTLVNYTEPQLNVPANYESYLDIEKYSGATFYITEKIQFNAELKPDALFPNLGLKGLQSVGYRTYLPTFFMEKIFAYSDHTIKKYYDPIKVVLHIIKWTQIVGYTVGALFVICVLGIFLRAYINKRRENRGEVAEDQEDKRTYSPMQDSS